MLLGAAVLADARHRYSRCQRLSPVPGMPNPELALQQSMNDVNAEMSELGQSTPAPTTPASAPVLPAPRQRIVSFSYSGPLDKAVAQLSQSVGYTFYVTAPPSAQPVNVAITISSVSAYQVFQALGEEAGRRRPWRSIPFTIRLRSSTMFKLGAFALAGAIMTATLTAGTARAQDFLTSPGVPPAPTPAQAANNVPLANPINSPITGASEQPLVVRNISSPVLGGIFRMRARVSSRMMASRPGAWI